MSQWLQGSHLEASYIKKNLLLEQTCDGLFFSFFAVDSYAFYEVESENDINFLATEEFFQIANLLNFQK